jgi:hypothetical protein
VLLDPGFRRDDGKVSESLAELVAAELAEPVDARVADMATAIASAYPQAARAVLFYGSCLRSREIEGQMLDFYLIVESYRAAYAKRWLAAANRLVPPNVFPFAHGALAAKYAVLSEDDFERECGLRGRSVSVWARFAQPSRLVWSADDAARERVVATVAQAALSVIRLAKASATFAGGIDYLAWKINRHAGTDIAIRPWQRRWPLLGALTLLPRLLRRGAIR